MPFMAKENGCSRKIMNNFRDFNDNGSSTLCGFDPSEIGLEMGSAADYPGELYWIICLSNQWQPYNGEFFQVRRKPIYVLVV